MSDDTAVRVADNPERKRFEGFLGDELVGVIGYIPLDGKYVAAYLRRQPEYADVVDTSAPH